MFEQRHPTHFLTHNLNTSVFSSPSQTQFSVPIRESILPPIVGRCALLLWQHWRTPAAQPSVEAQFTTSRGGAIQSS